VCLLRAFCTVAGHGRTEEKGATVVGSNGNSQVQMEFINITAKALILSAPRMDPGASTISVTISKVIHLLQVLYIQLLSVVDLEW
jgi:hypothetical protein